MDTMTVGELIAKLKEYPQDLPVLATWEDTLNPVLGDFMKVGEGFHRRPALIIDVN